MRVPFVWLKEYVEIFEPLSQVAEEISSLGYPVAGTGTVGAAVRGVLVGQVTSIEPHPKADLMKVCQIDLGDEGEAQIVTTAANVRLGQRVAAALHGSLLAGGTRIKRGRLRGVLSEGMLCSADELGLSALDLPHEQRHGLIEMPEQSDPGTDVMDLLGLDQQVILLTPWPERNPGGLIGLARELAVRMERSLESPSLAPAEASATGWFEEPDPAIVCELGVCLLQGVKLEPSPAWMARRLRAAGLHTVMNVLDIVRYVMVETGQPLHVYDLDRLRPPLSLRPSKPGESLRLGDMVRELPSGTWVVGDERGPVAVAGVAVGSDFQVRPRTRRVLVKAARYRPGLVEENGRLLGIVTESSRRFGAGPRASHLALALQRASWLLQRLARGRLQAVQTWRCDDQPEYELEPAFLERHLGRLDPGWLDQALVAAGISYHRVGSQLRVSVSAHRVLEDLVRLRGVDRLEAVPATLRAAPTDELDVRRRLAMMGFSEVVSGSLPQPWLGLLELARRRGQDELRLMEQVESELCLLVSGHDSAYFHLKGLLEMLAELAQAELSFEPAELPWLHPGSSARISLGNAPLGWLGVPHPGRDVQVHSTLAVALIDKERLAARARPRGLFDPDATRWVERDLAVLVPEQVWAGKVVDQARQAGGTKLLLIRCFDVYQGSQIPEGWKSLGLRFWLQCDREPEVKAILGRILEQLEQNFGARLRA